MLKNRRACEVLVYEVQERCEFKFVCNFCGQKVACRVARETVHSLVNVTKIRVMDGANQIKSRWRCDEVQGNWSSNVILSYQIKRSKHLTSFYRLSFHFNAATTTILVSSLKENNHNRGYIFPIFTHFIYFYLEGRFTERRREQILYKSSRDMNSHAKQLQLFDEIMFYWL